MADYPAPPTSLLWPDLADLPSTTSAGSGPSSQRTQCNSWSKRWSSTARTTATRSWLDSQPLLQNRCSVSRTLHSIKDVGAGLQGRQRNCARLPPNTGHTTSSPERALRSATSASWLVPPSLRPNKARSAKSRLCSGASVVE